MDAATMAHPLRARASSASTPSPPPASLSGFLSTLIPVLLVSSIMFLVFLVLRRTQKRQYAPRTYLPSLREHERSPLLPSGLLDWFGAFFKIPDTYVLNHQSIDGYLLLRFLKISTIICLVGCCITFPVLFPVNATAGGAGQQLDILSMSNVPKQSGGNPRLYAHAFVAWLYFGFIWFTIARETIFYINLRQTYLLAPLYSARISARTVLFTSVPADYLDESKIRRLFAGKAKNVWLVADCDALQELVDERDAVAFKLEAAETKLIKTANDLRLKSIKKGGRDEAAAPADVEPNGESGSVAARWISPKDRPTHRLTLLVGKKVDTINWCRSELERLVPEVDRVQAAHKAGEARFVGSVFVEFTSQAEAQAAFQAVTHHQPLHMAPRFIGVNPNEVIWSNLGIGWSMRIVRNILVTAAIGALVVFWAIPVAFVGTLSNINALMEQYTWLGFLKQVPPSIFGLITGLLPSVLLAVLMALLPIILRAFAKLSGAPTTSRVELALQNSYFLFQVVQVFLVTTLGSAATAVGAQIANDPSSALDLLAAKLPLASNFYISFFLVQGLTLAAGGILQIAGLIVYKLLGKLLDGTPRKMYRRFSSLGALGWGTVFPIYTLYVVISITYSCIAPLMLLFATVSLWLLYWANRYNLIFVLNCDIDTRGLVYPRALQHITTGLYLAEVCMIGLFAINTAVGPLILMIVFLIVSILFHISLNDAVSPLLYSLPQSLEIEEHELQALESGQSNGAQQGAEKTGAAAPPNAPEAPRKRPNLFTKWLHPDRYTDFQTLRRLVPKDVPAIAYSEQVESHAYYNPAISKPAPLLWIPEDPMGVSKQEIAHTSKIIPITDEGASFDEGGKLRWDESRPAPVQEEFVDY